MWQAWLPGLGQQPQAWRIILESEGGKCLSKQGRRTPGQPQRRADPGGQKSSPQAGPHADRSLCEALGAPRCQHPAGTGLRPCREHKHTLTTELHRARTRGNSTCSMGTVRTRGGGGSAPVVGSAPTGSLSEKRLRVLVSRRPDHAVLHGMAQCPPLPQQAAPKFGGAPRSLAEHSGRKNIKTQAFQKLRGKPTETEVIASAPHPQHSDGSMAGRRHPWTCRPVP